MDNMELYNKLRSVPTQAIKPITAGRLKGFSDVNPMWRIKALTEVFGACGFGWWYKITDKRMEGQGNEIRAFVDIELYVRYNGEVSQPIVGTGGSSFLTQEKNGAYTSDECYKMALTDAISVAAKALGVAADIYYERDRDKYTTTDTTPDAPKAPPATDTGDFKLTCADCGAPISVKVHDFSVKKFTRPLCMDCQKKQY